MSRRRPPRISGMLPVAKRSGPTSHDIVDLARKALRERRIGHTGTLDPMAEGLLLLCVGKATRLQQYLLDWEKEYLGEIRLGWATDTYDTEGEITTEKTTPPMIGDEELRRLEDEFSGSYDQLPPAFSAKKIGGKKAYELARKGEEVKVEPREVHVHSLRISREDEETLIVRLTVSSGFYVRSLAHDIGLKLGCGGHLRRLERLRIGPFETSDALPQVDLERAAVPEEILEGHHWVPLEKSPLPFQTLEINPGAAQRFVNGQEIVVLGKPEDQNSPGARLGIACEGSLLGIGTVQHLLARGRTLGIRPSLVLNPDFRI